MPKVSVYIPDDLYAATKALNLSISAVTQAALAAAVRAARNEAWVASVRSRPRRVTRRIDTQRALDAAREEFGS